MVVWYTGGGEEGKEGGEGEEGKEGGRRGAGPAARSPEQGRRAPGERRRQIKDEASRHQTRGESGERSATQRRGDLECEARVRVRGGPQRRLHFISRGGAGGGGLLGQPMGRGGTGPPFWTGPCHGPGWRPKPVLVPRAGPAWALWPPCRAVLGPGKNTGPWAGPRARGLHGHLYQ